LRQLNGRPQATHGLAGKIGLGDAVGHGAQRRLRVEEGGDVGQRDVARNEGLPIPRASRKGRRPPLIFLSWRI
jgi:hypothetical protein